jgi:hypothetical protein
MPSYEHVCSGCSGLTFVTKNLREDHCPLGHRQVRRSWGFQAFHRQIGDHFNHSVGKYVSNTRELRDELKRGAEKQSEDLGLEHNYVMADMRDRDIFPQPSAEEQMETARTIQKQQAEAKQKSQAGWA